MNNPTNHPTLPERRPNDGAEAAWQAKFNNGDMFDGTGKFNRYTCEACGFSIITIDRAKGATPGAIACKRQELTGIPCAGDPPTRPAGRPGVMGSHHYHPRHDNGGALRPKAIPDYEWYRPCLLELDKLEPSAREHVEGGGLLLRLAREEYDQCGACGHVRMRHVLIAKCQLGQGCEFKDSACNVEDCRCEEGFVEPPARTFTCIVRLSNAGVGGLRGDRFYDYWAENHWNSLYPTRWPANYPRPRTCSYCGAAREQDVIALLDAGWQVGDIKRHGADKAYLHPPAGVEQPIPPVTLRAFHMQPELFEKLIRQYKNNLLGHCASET